MRLTSPARRAAGLLAVTTIGVSTAVLSVTGSASADVTGDFTFSTSSADAANVTVGADGVLVVPEGYCSVEWTVVGGQGGAGSAAGEGGRGGFLYEVVDITGAQTYRLSPGTAGTAAEPESAEALADGMVGVGGENAVGDDGTDGASFGSGGGNAYSGGGGAGSRVEVMVDGTPADFLFAYGGDGGYADSDGDPAAGVGAGDTTNVYSDGTTDGSTGGDTGDGFVSGQAIACAVPPTDGPVTPPPGDQTPVDTQVTGAPRANWVYGVANGLDFQLNTSTVDSANPVTGVEYTLDGGKTWTGVAAANLGDYQYSGTITGLESGATYSVNFRFTTKQAPTAASDTVTGRTAVPGPRDVKAVAGPASIKVNWAAPASLEGVAGYLVTASPEGAQSSAGSRSCQPAAALGTACALPAVPGTTYKLSVHSLDAVGERLGRSDQVTVGPVLASSVAASLPKADGTLTSDDADGKVVAGEKITISGKDFLPGSTVDLVVYSTPVELGTATVLADGTFSATVTLPKELANGTHHLVASGVDANGNPRNLVVEVTVSGGTAVLAYTGFSPLPFVGAGALALVAGGGLLVASRRRAQ
ncbi:fibronectin type III domain-containing protein [Modestobacter sp. VKM Ac-2977]|uniref:fibronectin type III domain-containing protein n=1 Tax=Modestobacter sp. VKM Ac-2977 TaxID=3004131 RepID=UPI0022AAAF85|nr:fibronectin type III domain-containing protein [Modestobacter sp. VKM Ac-2977]MCZ2822684.1 fibronectin type III domain-containing protein [Modestobacter sp. VKM Ac-2977]